MRSRYAGAIGSSLVVALADPLWYPDLRAAEDVVETRMNCGKIEPSCTTMSTNPQQPWLPIEPYSESPRVGEPREFPSRALLNHKSSSSKEEGDVWTLLRVSLCIRPILGGFLGQLRPYCLKSHCWQPRVSTTLDPLDTVISWLLETCSYERWERVRFS